MPVGSPTQPNIDIESLLAILEGTTTWEEDVRERHDLTLAACDDAQSAGSTAWPDSPATVAESAAAKPARGAERLGGMLAGSVGAPAHLPLALQRFQSTRIASTLLRLALRPGFRPKARSPSIEPPGAGDDTSRGKQSPVAGSACRLSPPSPLRRFFEEMFPKERFAALRPPLASRWR